MWAAAKLGFTLRIAAPAAFQPAAALVARARAAGPGKIEVTDDLSAAASGADVLYTDVWVSMGREEETAFRLAQLARYQIDDALVGLAKRDALVMHCLPAYRGKEITAEVMEAHAETIFSEAENRLHAQKAVLSWLVS
jgi:ornithine carbamoyltransferase